MPPADSTLDSFDLRILALYQHDARLPAERIGEQVGLSTAAVQRRLKRMRENGTIEAETARVSPTAVGLALTMVVNVKMEREGGDALARFRTRMAACPDVQQCYYVTGEMDFVLLVVVRDMDAYERFTRDNLHADDNVRGFTTQVVMDRCKVGTALAF